LAFRIDYSMSVGVDKESDEWRREFG